MYMYMYIRSAKNAILMGSWRKKTYTSLSSVYLSLSLFVCLSVCLYLSVCLSVSLSIYVIYMPIFVTERMAESTSTSPEFRKTCIYPGISFPRERYLLIHYHILTPNCYRWLHMFWMRCAIFGGQRHLKERKKHWNVHLTRSATYVLGTKYTYEGMEQQGPWWRHKSTMS